MFYLKHAFSFKNNMFLNMKRDFLKKKYNNKNINANLPHLRFCSSVSVCTTHLKSFLKLIHNINSAFMTEPQQCLNTNLSLPHLKHFQLQLADNILLT